MHKTSNILVLGGNGMVGKTLISKLKSQGYENVYSPRSSHLNLLEQKEVREVFATIEPSHIFFLAAKVGGIMANISSPAVFGYENLMMQNNVIQSAHEMKVKKLLFMGSSCIYPRECPQPMKEEYLLTGPVEPTNEMYALAKIAGLKLCAAYKKQYNDNFISCMPCNLYGQNDNFDLKTSHVMSGLIRKFHEAKIEKKEFVQCLGTGSARREFLHVEDVADACIFLMHNYDNSEHINVGSGTDCTIKELSETIKRIVGYTGEIHWDSSRPDGMPRKIMDVTKLANLGWKSKISLEDGIIKTYNWFKENIK